ncbi:leucine-rich repeat protein, partial [Tanacetum coccineum]
MIKHRINQFSRSIPNAIGNLSLLTQLYLYSNKLEGHIPSSLGNCKELNGLNLGDNRLSGEIPKQLLQLPSLTNFLALSHNNLSGRIPQEIKDLKMLSYLDLSYNNLSGNITSSLGTAEVPSASTEIPYSNAMEIDKSDLTFGIHPFYIEKSQIKWYNKGFNHVEAKGFKFLAPTTRRNSMRVLRAMQLKNPVLLEASPGVGKTSLVLALGKFSGHSGLR